MPWRCLPVCDFEARSGSYANESYCAWLLPDRLSLSLTFELAFWRCVSYDTHMRERITQVEYSGFQKAYDFFNRELFNNTLPAVLITLQRKSGAAGYFSPDRFRGRLDDSAAHELALNPDSFLNRSDEEILSTLAHEMVHVWQETHGDPPRRSYHDRRWAAKMREIGLQPSHDGKPGGKETGQHVSHYILPDGPFARTCRGLLNQIGFRLHWQSSPARGASAVTKLASKTKYTCPVCGQNAWAKPGAKLFCGGTEPCGTFIEMLPQPRE